MPKSKVRVKKKNRFGAKRDELALWGLEVANYYGLIQKITDYKKIKNSELGKLMREIKEQEGFIGIHATNFNMFADTLKPEEYSCLALFDTPEHRNNAYNKINKLEGLAKEQMQNMTDVEIIKQIKVLLCMRTVLVKKQYYTEQEIQRIEEAQKQI